MMKTHAVMLIAIVAAALTVQGCSGYGLAGGQGISISASNGSNIEHVYITIDDGGFNVDPTGAAKSKPQATTKPAKPQAETEKETETGTE